MSAGGRGGRTWWASAEGQPLQDPPRPGGGHHHRAGSDEACRTCPVCSLVRAVDAVRPELVEHLTEAARHLTLAAKAIIDAQAERFADRSTPLQHIPLDEDGRAGD